LTDDVRARKPINQTAVPMPDIDMILPFWEGFSVVSASLIGETLQIHLIPHHAQMPSCSGCLYPCSLIHDQVERSIRDLPIFGHRSFSSPVSEGCAAPTAAHERSLRVGWIVTPD
jgi:hypothetical protein